MGEKKYTALDILGISGHNRDMPELPEIETIRRGLDLTVLGQTLQSVGVIWPKTMPYAQELIKSKVEGHKVLKLRRFAKVLVVDLDSDYSLMFHLKMTGQLVLVKSDGVRFAGGHPTGSMTQKLPDRSSRAVFVFVSGDKLFFNDQRKFGWIKLVDTVNVVRDSLIARLGPEPLSNEFDVARLTLNVQRHARASIKAIILDQSTVSGVGNIYADESLHLAKIHPSRLGGSLSTAEIKRLHGAIKTIIALGIEYGGTSFTNYVNALGQKGDYLDHARVFRRQGLPCAVCGTVIEKIRVAGRGTHVCSVCQKP